jgi:glycosyltransferase involved in cell wall biosynthesis
VRVQLVDPSAFTPPYDRSLAAALARAGVEAELLTSRFLYGPVPPADGYAARDFFYRRSARRGLDAPARRAFKLAEHVVDMARLRRALDADVVHYQWLTVPPLDSLLLPGARPRVMTAHYILPPRPSRRARAAARRLFGRMDAAVAHSEHGARRLREEVGLDPDRVRVIPHGALDYLTRLPEERPLPPELEGGGAEASDAEDTRAARSAGGDAGTEVAASEGTRAEGSAGDPAAEAIGAERTRSAGGGAGGGSEAPVVLFFGLLRSYKGLDTLLEAFREVRGAELWIVGRPRLDVEPLRRLAAAAPGRVRFLTRFVEDAEIPAIFRRADLVVLPYRDAEHSGVLYTALAFGKPLLLSAVGGFPEVAATGAARLVPPEDPAALAAALQELTGDEAARAELAAAARAAAAGPYSWDEAARRTLALYEDLLEPHPHRSAVPFPPHRGKRNSGRGRST